MKFPISRFTLVLLATVILGETTGRAQEPQPSFFSFLNAINSGDPTTLSVNGKKMGDPAPLGFYTGGMGFMEKNAALSVENGSLPKKEGTLPLSPETCPIAIAYLKVEPAPAGSEAPPKKSIVITAIPCSLAPKSSRVRVVYIGGQDPITLTAKGFPRGGGKTPTASLTLRPGIPVELPLKESSLSFFVGDTPVGSRDTEGRDNYLLVFYPDDKGKLVFTSVLDFVQN